MNCLYCGTENEVKSTHCAQCGAELPNTNKDTWKSEPFFYNGYIVYTLRNFITCIVEWQFWLGKELQERIVLSEEIAHELSKDGYDIMPYIWNLFLVAKGEKEVFEYQEKNKKYPAHFEVRRIENEEKQNVLRSLGRQ